MTLFKILLSLSCFHYWVLLVGQNAAFDQDLMHALKYRSVGPSRGGRVTAVCGVRQDIHSFYMGSTGGGIWRTGDAGTTWQNISDDFFDVGSIGAISVSPSDPNVIYVGTGSAALRGNVSIGKGIYKSVDRGMTWQKIGLEKTGQIGKIAVHPTDPDQLYAAALGNPFGHNKERGVYRSKDGGETWEQVLFVSEKTGAIDLVVDPNNPRIIFAAMWTAERKPWTMIDGSEESGIWKSTDGGNHWKRVKGGLPEGLAGKAGIAISPANSQRMWVIQETADEEKGGLYSSEDGGTTWKRINRKHNLRQRAWYYNHIYPHPTDENTIYIMNVGFHKSIDGGENFTSIEVPHGDNHALWINPDYPRIMIEGNDGGACVSLNGGATWSTQNNQPTAEFYRVAVDNQFPYRLYGAQQDNTTISVPSKPMNYLDPLQDWYSVGGGESGHIAIDPRNPNLVYAGTYIGQIDRTDLARGHTKDVVAYPQMHDGTAGRDIKYRFQWNAPIRLSPHNPEILYHCSQYVHRSSDGGKSWKVISPDLTTNKDEYQSIPGGPIQHDHTGVELYTTIFALEESPHQQGELWAGSDDGLIHISRDNGSSWKNITPEDMPREGTINMIDLSTHSPGRALVAVYKYRENDFRPYIFLTENYGSTWKLLTSGENGIPKDHFVRVVREDPNRKGLLYAGTEFGMYISFNAGQTWCSFQQNLPITPITDMVIKGRDLVVATQGRSFWIMDDLTPLHSWNPEDTMSIALYASPEVCRTQLRSPRSIPKKERAPQGAIIYYFLPEAPDSNSVFSLRVKDANNIDRRILSSEPDKEKNEESIAPKRGLNRFVWDLRYEKPKTEEGAVFSLADMSGIKAPPGPHQIEITLGDQTLSQSLTLGKDPRWKQSDEDLQAQYDLTYKAMKQLNQLHRDIADLRGIRKQLKTLTSRKSIKDKPDVTGKMDSLISHIDSLEQKLIQTRSESGQDPINYPSQIDDQFAYLYSVLNGQDDRPNEGAYQRLEDLNSQLKPLSDQIIDIKEEVTQLNAIMAEMAVPLIESHELLSRP